MIPIDPDILIIISAAIGVLLTGIVSSYLYEWNKDGTIQQLTLNFGYTILLGAVIISCLFISIGAVWVLLQAIITGSPLGVI